jgi:hypothetical protein
MPKSTKKKCATLPRIAAAAATGATSSKSKPRPAKTAQLSKQSRVVAMLRSPKGATIAAMMKATGWQQHSVRGFLAGVIRKRLKLTLKSEMISGNRVYHVEPANIPTNRSKST